MNHQILSRLEQIEKRIHEITQLEPDSLSASLLSVTIDELKRLAEELDAEVRQ